MAHQVWKECCHEHILSSSVELMMGLYISIWYATVTGAVLCEAWGGGGL